MPKKTVFISLSVLLAIGLLAGVFQYVQTLKAELASAVTVGTPNPGHAWAQMQCSATSLCIDTANNRVGIGTNTPSNQLYINGSGGILNLGATGWIDPGATGASIVTDNNGYKALMIVGNNVVGNSGMGREVKVWDYLNVQGALNTTGAATFGGNVQANGDVCNGGGKCLSSVFQTNVIAGTNPTCPSGQTAIMRAYNGTWYVPSQVSTWSQVTCGQLMSSDGTALLVNSQHTSKNCTDAGGTVIGDGSGNNMCRLGTSACPNGWSWYGGWSTVLGATAGDYPTCGCSVGGHAWTNDATLPTCSAGCSHCFGECGCGICSATATRTQIGCY